MQKMQLGNDGECGKKCNWRQHVQDEVAVGESELMRRRGRLVQCNRTRVGEPRTLVSQN